VTTRLAALALLLAALAVYLAVARPLRQQERRTSEEHRRLRDERRVQQSKLAALERREARHRSLAAAARAWGQADAVREARLAVVRTLDQAALHDVRLGVSAATRPAALASVKLSAQGEFEDVVRTSGELVRPGSGFVLDSVRLSPREQGVILSVEAWVPGTR
jgi:hypothetical protein